MKDLKKCKTEYIKASKTLSS